MNEPNTTPSPGPSTQAAPNASQGVSPPSGTQPASSTPAAPAAVPEAPPLTRRASFTQGLSQGLQNLRQQAERARGPDGKFVSPAQQAPAATAAPATPAATPAAAPATEAPAIDFSALGFGKVPLDQAPQFVESMIAHKTREAATKLQAYEQQIAQHNAVLAKAREDSAQLDQLIQWGQTNPQGLVAFLGSLRQPSAAQGYAHPMQPQQAGFAQAAPAFGAPPQGPQPQYLTREQAQAQFEQMWAQRETAQREAAQRAEAERADTIRIQQTLETSLRPIIGGEHADVQALIKDAIAARLVQDRANVETLPEPMLVQRILAEATRARDGLRAAHAAMIAAQTQITQNAPPPITGGNNMVPREERSFAWNDRNGFRQSLNEGRARLRSGM